MKTTNRLSALDTFRGATIALMIIVNTPGTWSHVYAPLRHAQWHGCTLTDLVFPFFLFIALTFEERRKINHQQRHHHDFSSFSMVLMKTPVLTECCRAR